MMLTHQYYHIGQYVTPVISGQPPRACHAFTYNAITSNSGVLYGGWVPGGPSNNLYITTLTRNTVVSLYYIIMYTVQYKIV